MKMTDVSINLNNIKRPVSILLLSDLHISKENDSRNLSGLLKKLDCQKCYFDYICIVGDLINSSLDLNDENYVWKLAMIVNKLSTYAKKVIISIGNHDAMYKNSNNEWNASTSEEIKQLLKNYTDSIVLDNDKFIDNYSGITFYGLTNSFQFYELMKEDSTLYERELLEFLTRDFNLNGITDDNNARILLSHSANGILKNKLVDYFSLILSGHYHNGCVPPILENFLGNTGLIDGQNNLFPKNCRGIVRNEKSFLILNGAINPFNEINILNNLYGASSKKLVLTPKTELSK